MRSKQPTITIRSPDKQLDQLSQQIETLLSQQESLDSFSPGVWEQLETIQTHLEQIRLLVAYNEDERQKLRSLADIGQLVNSSLDLPVVLQTVMDTIIRLTGAERGFLMLRNQFGKWDIQVARNWEQESVKPSEFAISKTIINRVLKAGISVLTTNAQEDPRFGGQESIIAHNLRSILCVPLKNKEEITGVIYTDNRIRSGIFTASERDLLSAFANQAAVAIENARLFQSVRRTLGEVTNLKNLMDNVFSSIASGVITADIEDRIALCNRAAEFILDLDTPKIIGQSLHDISTPIARDLNRHLDIVRNEDRPIVGLELKTTLPQRGPVDLRFHLSPLKDSQEKTHGVAIVVDDLTEKKRLQALHRLFERMVSPAVIEQLDPDQLRLGGSRKEITTLFADLRGFTSFGENLDPVQMVSVLNRYLGVATDAVLSQEGMLNKFMGDAIMAIFNAPIPQPDHTLRAVQAALHIQEAVQALHQEFPPDLHLWFGIGIHYGEAVLGLVGSEQRLEYTAVGDSVNIAKRLQENSQPNQILISAQAYQPIANKIHAQSTIPITAKGKKYPLSVFAVQGMKTPGDL